MKKRISVSDVAGFSVAERIQFVEDVWTVSPSFRTRSNYQTKQRKSLIVALNRIIKILILALHGKR